MTDKGFGVNVMVDRVRKQLGLPPPQNVGFILRMANHARVHPLGLMRIVPTVIKGFTTPNTDFLHGGFTY